MTALSRRDQVERILGRCCFGQPAVVRAYYALGAQPLFVEAKEGLVDFWGSNASYTELLWYLELCEHRGVPLTFGTAVSWILHREDDACGLCRAVVQATTHRPVAFPWGLQVRLCWGCAERWGLHGTPDVHQKLRDGKVCA
jgi:hypothetical protein